MRIRTLALAALVLGATPAAAQTWQSSYPEVDNPLYAQMRDGFVAGDLFAAMLTPLNEHFPVPRTVTVEMDECGEERSRYDRARPAITLCYELIEEMANAFITGDAEEDEMLIAGASAYLVVHQVGHALIDQLQLPVRVPPEEAADQFTAFIMGFTGDEAQKTLAGVLTLSETGIEWEGAGAVSPARAQTMACLLYGSDPQGFGWAVEQGALPAARAAGCEEDLDRVREEWTEMLTAASPG